MNERLTLPARRIITPVTALLAVLVLAAALALGFGLRSWTQSSSGGSTAVVRSTHLNPNARDEAARRTVAAVYRAATATDATTPLVATRGHR